MTEERNLVHRVPINVRWGDLDAFRHVNSALYFRYCEDARASWLHSIGQSVSGGAKKGPVIVNSFCAFLKPIRYPARLTVDVFAGPPGRTSFETYYEIRDAANQETLYAQARAKVVWLDRKLDVSVPLPSELTVLLPRPIDPE